MGMLVPRYLDISIASLTPAGKIPQSDGAGIWWQPVRRAEEQVRRNMEMFERAFAMFTPFARRPQQHERC